MNEPDMKRLLHLVDSTQSRLAPPPRIRAEGAIRRGTTLWRRRRAAGAVALLIIAAGVLVPISMLVSLGHSPNIVGYPAAGLTEPAPMGIAPPNGWDSQALNQGPKLGPVVRAANFPLPQPGADFHTAISRSMPSNGTLLVIQEFVGVCGCDGFQPVSLPLSLSTTDLTPWGNDSRATQTFTTDDHFFALYVELGPKASLDDANNALASFSVGGEWQPNPETMPDNQLYAPPEFGNSAGWNSASMAAPRNADALPIAWASTEPLDPGDLKQVPETANLSFPVQTMSKLPNDGVVIVASLPLPDKAPAAADNPNFPDRSLPLQVTDAEPRTQWEGQVAPNVPEYLLLARVNEQYVDVRIYFGTLDPSPSTIAKAQDELNTLSIPSPSPAG